MKIQTIITLLEEIAPLAYQEDYDNCGLITGHRHWTLTGILCTLDVTEGVIEEAMARGCNLVVAHHPIIFRGLKKLSGDGYVQRTVTRAIKNDIAIYAVHTNLDNVKNGVNAWMADKIGLDPKTFNVLAPKPQLLKKMATYVPSSHAGQLKEALFAAGAGNIGNYGECSFAISGQGTFRPLEGTNPFIGTAGGKRETVDETKIEFIFPQYLQNHLIQTLFNVHPYEEVAYEILPLDNDFLQVGSGLTGDLPEPVSPQQFLALIRDAFQLRVIRHTALPDRPVQRVAVCGGSGSFLTANAIAASADVYITSDVKYHEFFDADGKILLMDIGHFESEQYTIDGLVAILQSNFPTFAVLKTRTVTNPVHYFF